MSKENVKNALDGIYLFDNSFEHIKEILDEKNVVATDKEIFEVVNEMINKQFNHRK